MELYTCMFSSACAGFLFISPPLLCLPHSSGTSDTANNWKKKTITAQIGKPAEPSLEKEGGCRILKRSVKISKSLCPQTPAACLSATLARLLAHLFRLWPPAGRCAPSTSSGGSALLFGSECLPLSSLCLFPSGCGRTRCCPWTRPSVP